MFGVRRMRSNGEGREIVNDNVYGNLDGKCGGQDNLLRILIFR